MVARIGDQEIGERRVRRTHEARDAHATLAATEQRQGTDEPAVAARHVHL